VIPDLAAGADRLAAEPQAGDDDRAGLAAFRDERRKISLLRAKSMNSPDSL
jgi:hypothetical protein